MGLCLKSIYIALISHNLDIRCDCNALEHQLFASTGTTTSAESARRDMCLNFPVLDDLLLAFAWADVAVDVRNLFVLTLDVAQWVVVPIASLVPRS